MFKKHLHILVMTNPTASITATEVECGYKKVEEGAPCCQNLLISEQFYMVCRPGRIANG